MLRFSPGRTMLWVLVPACLPDIVNGLRISFSLSSAWCIDWRDVFVATRPRVLAGERDGAAQRAAVDRRGHSDRPDCGRGQYADVASRQTDRPPSELATQGRASIRTSTDFSGATASGRAKRSFDKTAMFAKPQYQELHNERRGHGTRPHHLNEFAERHHRSQPTFVTKSANNRISSANVRKVTGSGTTALCDEVLLPTVAPEFTTAFAHASGRAARVSFNISFENRSSSTRRASTIAPTMADHAAIAERRFPSGVSPSASAAR